MTQLERDKMIRELISNDIANIETQFEDMSEYLTSIFKYGVKGFNDYTDDELIEEHMQAFG